MNRDEAIAIIRKEYLCVDRDCDIDRSCGKCDLMMPSKDPILEAYKMAIKALEQQPCDMKQRVEKEYLYESLCEDLKKANAEIKRLSEPCDDTISRQAVCKIIDDIRDCVSVNGYWAFLERLKKLPPVTPQPKTGRWVAYEVRLPDRTILNYRCSVCGRKLIGYSTETLSEAPFCHCGAKMVEPQERSDKE